MARATASACGTDSPAPVSTRRDRANTSSIDKATVSWASNTLISLSRSTIVYDMDAGENFKPFGVRF